MSENIASRVGRLLSGTVNSLVDAVENMAPEIVMEQAIREVDQAIVDIRSELGKVVAQQHMTTSRIDDENKRHKELSANIEIALSEGREDLAETAVGKILDIESQLPVMESTLTAAKEQQVELEGYIDALQARKREMQEELKNFRDAKANSITQEVTNGSSEGSVASSVSKAEEAFDRVMNSSINMAGMSQRHDLNDASQLAELDKLARSSKIKERLEAIKNKS